MLSRVADSIYWMNRYLERAENVARFIDVNYNLTLGAGNELSNQWAPLIYTTGDHQDFQQRCGDFGRETVLRFLAFDRENPNSIVACIAKARENARSVRETISMALWEQLNRFHLMVQSAAKDPEALYRSPTDFCDQVKVASHTLVGIADTTMSHGEAWHFSQLGRLLERADKTSRIVDVQYFLLLPGAVDVGSSLDVVRWSALLKSASALEMYRREHGRIEPSTVADFLILNRNFPRSMHYCIVRAQESVRQIAGSHTGTFSFRSEKLLGRLRSDLDYTQIRDIVGRGMHEFIDNFQVRLNEVGEALHSDFFTKPVAIV